jgi:hypothetical protein
MEGFAGLDTGLLLELLNAFIYQMVMKPPGAGRLRVVILGTRDLDS